MESLSCIFNSIFFSASPPNSFEGAIVGYMNLIYLCILVAIMSLHTGWKPESRYVMKKLKVNFLLY